MLRETLRPIGTIMLLLAISGPALATPLSVTRLGSPIPDSTRIVSGIRLAAPPGAVRFCRDYPQECIGGDTATVELTQEKWELLSAVNREINATIVPRRDSGPDHWSLDSAAGDCDEFAALKRHALIAGGWPVAAVGLAVVRTVRRETHLVAVVRTDRGDFVLDNLANRVLPWEETGHRFVMMTDSANPRLWFAVEAAGDSPARAFEVGSLRVAREGP